MDKNREVSITQKGIALVSVRSVLEVLELYLRVTFPFDEGLVPIVRKAREDLLAELYGERT